VRSVLVTGAGGSAGNNVCWSLRVSKDGKKILLDGTDVDRTSIELNGWIDRAYQLPTAKSSRYLASLNKVIERDRVEIVVPQPDPEVGRLSRDRDQVSAAMFLPDREAVRVCQDKYEALARWFRIGLRREPVVLSYGSRKTRQTAQKLAFPCWVRARQGAGGSLSCLARNWRSVEYWIGYHWTEGLKIDFVVEEYLPNRDFCFMSIWKQGTLITSMVRERLSWVGHRIVGSGGTSKLNRVVHSKVVNTTAIDAIRAVSGKPHGIFCVDLKGDSKGVPRPTEINCRFTTNVHYLTLASLKLGHPEWNFPWLAARLCLGEKIPSTKTLNALPANLWFTKNTDMGFTMVEDGKWRAENYS
jgi:predicted ATP-grasp superfamily ATP-dependent carboligase